MHLFYCDETNLEERTGDFLIYGGLMVEADRALDLSTALDDLRTQHGVPREYQLKFNPGPKGFTHEKFIALKHEALKLTATHDGRLVVYVILHDIAAGPDQARRNGINTVCYHFHCILNGVGGPGLVLIDRFNDKGSEIDAHLRDKFTIGLTWPQGDETRLPNILGFHYSAMGQSHLPSLIDVALGSLRFAINAHTRGKTQNLNTARALLGLLSPLFWRAGEGEPVPEQSFQFSPKNVQVPHHRTEYEALKQFLADCGIATEQQITNQRLC